MLKLGPIFKNSRPIVKKGASQIQNSVLGSSKEALSLPTKGPDPVMRLSEAFAQISVVEPPSVLTSLKKNEVTFSYPKRSYSTYRSLRHLNNSQNDNNALVHKMSLEEVLNLLSKVGIPRAKVGVKSFPGNPFIEYESPHFRCEWTEMKSFKSFTIEDIKDITACAHVERIDPAGSISFIIELVNCQGNQVFSQSRLRLDKFKYDSPVPFSENDMFILSKLPTIPDVNISQRNKCK